MVGVSEQAAVKASDAVGLLILAAGGVAAYFVFKNKDRVGAAVNNAADAAIRALESFVPGSATNQQIATAISSKTEEAGMWLKNLVTGDEDDQRRFVLVDSAGQIKGARIGDKIEPYIYWDSVRHAYEKNSVPGTTLMLSPVSQADAAAYAVYVRKMKGF